MVVGLVLGFEAELVFCLLFFLFGAEIFRVRSTGDLEFLTGVMNLLYPFELTLSGLFTLFAVVESLDLASKDRSSFFS